MTVPRRPNHKGRRDVPTRSPASSLPTLADFADSISRLPGRPLIDADVRRDRFLLHRQDNIEVFYAPLDYVNAQAKVALVGITPGATQMRSAFGSARDDLRAGLGVVEVSRRAKMAASFAGTMRRNLVGMLDALGLPALLGIRTSADLFGSANELAHTTSAVRYPVFVDQQNYTGSRPDLMRTPLLRGFVDEILRAELQTTPDAIVIPLGVKASAAVQNAVTTKCLEPVQVLSGFPHPSGGNGHRVRQFAEGRHQMRAALRSWFST